MLTDQKVRLAGQVRLHSSRSFGQIGATRSSSCDVGLKGAGEGPCTYNLDAYARLPTALVLALEIMLASKVLLFERDAAGIIQSPSSSESISSSSSSSDRSDPALPFFFPLPMGPRLSSSS